MKAHDNAVETMEETLRRLSRMPDPHEFAEPFSPDEVDEIEDAIEDLIEQGPERLRAVREAFDSDE